MLEELPKGWVKTRLGDIRRDNSIAISQEQMRDEKFSQGNPEVVSGNTIGSNKVLVSPGDVLLCKINPRINRAWVVGEAHGIRQIASTEWIVFSKQEGLSPNFLRYFFSLDTFRDYLAANVSGVGGSLMRVRPSVVEVYPFVLPPTAEQDRIAAKLDAALTRMANGEKAARRALERLQRYRAAVLQAAVIGELTREWRGVQQKNKKTEPETAKALLQRLLAARRARWEEAELKRLSAAGKEPKNDKWKSHYPEPVEPRVDDPPELPGSWCWASVDQLAAHEERSITDGPFGSNLKTSHYTDSGPRVVRIQNIGDAVFIDQKAHISRGHYESLRDHAVYAGDLVIRALGMPAPRACKIPESLGPAIVKADCIRFKVASEFISPDYVLWALNSPPVQARTGKMYNGPQNLDSVISYTWEIKGGGPSGTNAKEVSAFI
jgi:type I restriction enzyme S subunit